MRIDKIVDAPREFIFEKIVDSCLFDIEKNTGKRPKVRSLNGYEYNKSFGKNQRGTIKITELREPSIYAFTTKTNRNTFRPTCSIFITFLSSLISALYLRCRHD